MTGIVIDPSVASAWWLPDETKDRASVIPEEAEKAETAVGVVKMR